jgi:hypothetical protein
MSPLAFGATGRGQCQAEERAGLFPVGRWDAQHGGDEHVVSQARRHYHGSWISQLVPRLAAETGVEFSVAEQCLAHAIGGNVTRSYLRTSMLELRLASSCVVGVICLRRDGDSAVELRRAGP